MFVRRKMCESYEYLQIVHNEWVSGPVRQRVIVTLGWLDLLRKTGQIDSFLASRARFAEATAVLMAHRQGRTATTP